MEMLGLITARGGSKGIPGKNIRPVAGKPLLVWTIQAARAAASVTRLLLSTDSPDIAAVAASHGLDVPFLRPPALARDDSPHIDTLLHALDWIEAQGQRLPDYVLTLQPTSPLRTAADIDAAAAIAAARRPDAVIGVCPAERHPCLLRTLGRSGELRPLAESPVAYPRRQDLPAAYGVNGAIYINSTLSLRKDRTLFPENALAYVMPRERSLDIDEPLDLAIAALLLTRA
jgi:CMP-N-acetylneuraminic acid synthetase